MTETPSRCLWHCWLVLYVVGTRAKLWLWQIACRSLNNVAVTRKRTLDVLRLLRIKLCCTILKVRISIALTRNNNCTNIELKYRVSFSQELRFEAIFYWPFYFCMRQNVQLNFCVFEKHCFALFLDPGFRIPDSSFPFPVNQALFQWTRPCLYEPAWKVDLRCESFSEIIYLRSNVLQKWDFFFGTR